MLSAEHHFGTIKALLGAAHFLMKRLRNVAASEPTRYPRPISQMMAPMQMTPIM